MIDYLAAFTPTELELLKSQNGKFTLNGSVLEFDDDLPEELLEKIGRLSRQFVVETWQNPATRREEHDVTVRKFLAVIGLTTEKTATSDGAGRSLMVLLDERTALSIISDNKIRNNIKNLGVPGQMFWDFDENGNGVIAGEHESILQKALTTKKDTQGYNVVLLQSIGTGIEAVYKYGQCGDDDTVQISRVGLQKFLNIKIRKPKKDDIDFLMKNREPKTDAEKKQYSSISKSYPFWIDLINLSKAGTMETADGFYTIFNFKGYNEVEDVIECSSPFLFHSYMDLYNNAILGPKRNNEISYKIIKTAPPVVKGSLYTLKNKHSVEIIEELLYRLADRGTGSDAKHKSHLNFDDNKKVTIKVTYKELLKTCPALHKSFFEPITKKDGTTAEPDAQYKRTVLRRAVFGENKTKRIKDQDGKYTKKTTGKTQTTKAREESSLIEVALRNHTTLYKYYSDFHIKVDPISLKALNRTGITISHRGKRGEYQLDPELRSPEIVEN